MQEMQVQSLGQEEHLEKEMVTHSSVLVRKNFMDRGGWWDAQSMGSQRIRHNCVHMPCHATAQQLYGRWRSGSSELKDQQT